MVSPNNFFSEIGISSNDFSSRTGHNYHHINQILFLYNLLFHNFTLSNDSAFAKTIKANPRDRPVLGSVLTLMLSISPYVPK